MRLLENWMGAAVALTILSGAAFADVTVSQSNDPTASVEGRLSLLLGVERSGLGQVAPTQMQALAEAVTAPKPAAKPGVVPAISYDAAWLAAQPAATGDGEWQCMTQALYFEARGETVKGEFAVAEVILNRKDSPRYPGTICGVVHQGGQGGCQFSFTCDGYSDTIREADAYVQAGKIARLMLDGAPRALTLGATHFHTRSVRPGWGNQFAQTASIGAHVFYRQVSGS